MSRTASRLRIEMRQAGSLRPYANNARRHSMRQVKQITGSIERFGFTNPVLVPDDGEIVAGLGRVAAAQLLGLREVPVIALSHLTAAEGRPMCLPTTSLRSTPAGMPTCWRSSGKGLIDLDFDVTITGFILAGVDLVLDAARDRVDRPDAIGPEDQVLPLPTNAVTRRGDLWALGRHRLLCGYARSRDDHVALMGDEPVDLIFTDPP